MNITALGNYILPIVVFLIIGIALLKKISLFDTFIEGAKDGISLGFQVFPCLLGMIFGINILLRSNLISDVFELFSPIFSFFNFPKEILPLALIRPISGNASFAMMIDIFKTYGVDSYLGRIASVMQGATDTSIYVISLYFGSIGIKNIRYALKAGLFADFITLVISILLISLIF